MKKTHKTWTADEDDYLCQHYKTDGGASVADALGRTISSVKECAKRVGAAKKINVKTKALTAEQRAEFARLYPDTTNKEIAERFGLSEKSICSIAHRLKAASRPNTERECLKAT